MKKKIFTFTLLISLLASACIPMLAEQTFSARYFTLEIPDSWKTDTNDLQSEKGQWELGYLYPSGTVCIYAELTRYEQWSDFSLWNADEAGTAEYLQVLLEDYKEYSPRLFDTIYAGRIPFLILELKDKDGTFYWAETMTNGYTVGFECYSLSSDRKSYRDVTAAELEAFLDVLKTFKPVY